MLSLVLSVELGRLFYVVVKQSMHDQGPELINLDSMMLQIKVAFMKGEFFACFRSRFIDTDTNY